MIRTNTSPDPKTNGYGTDITLASLPGCSIPEREWEGKDLPSQPHPPQWHYSLGGISMGGEGCFCPSPHFCLPCDILGHNTYGLGTIELGQRIGSGCDPFKCQDTSSLIIPSIWVFPGASLCVDSAVVWCVTGSLECWSMDLEAVSFSTHFRLAEILSL